VEVDDEECFVGHDFFAPVVFFAFDPAVTACEFSTEGFGYSSYFSVWVVWVDVGSNGC